MVSDADAVVEGRDIASVVFPDADAKVFLDASAEVRALRRFRQGVSDKSLEQLRASIAARDRIDRNKAEGSLRIVPGAVVIDTTHLTMEEVCARVSATIREARTHTQNPGASIGNG
jgi:cytidylate kinase